MLIFSLLAILHFYFDIVLLHFYFDIVLYKKIRMSHKELPKETSNLKIFDGSGDNTVNDLLPIPIIH